MRFCAVPGGQPAVDPPKIAGPGDRLQRARDEWELYLGEAKQPNERDYLLGVFDELTRLPGAKDIFGQHNPIRDLPNWLSGDAARELLRFFQKIDADTGLLVHDFTDPTWETRFLGDLYQDLSEAARKKYALLQTPEFVEEFILDRTLEPALNEFGLDGFRMIDPACGSGHFLLGSFRRILDRWQRQEPATPARELVRRTLESIHGVDLNPFAVAIARFRVLLAAMRACGVMRLADRVDFRMNLVCGDSLLHGAGAPGTFGWDDFDHVYQTEDKAELVRILKPGHYHAVVANPPYITPKDKALNDAYRERYSTCHMKYSLSVPFMQRFFQLAMSGYGDQQRRGGFVGQITANSFMKREFGKKLIEEYFAGRDGTSGVDLTHVIDTSGAYIPGHGTPTVILFGRNRAPVAKTIRAVMGIRGEPSTPDDPAKGLVWSAIVAQIDQPGSQSEFVSVADSPRELFHKHPWSIGGGGAAELKLLLDQAATNTLHDVAETAIGVVTLEDDAFADTADVFSRHRFRLGELVGFVEGDTVRDWAIHGARMALFPYERHALTPLIPCEGARRLWPLRSNLRKRLWFGKTQDDRGLKWFEYGMLSHAVYRTPLTIVGGEVATHNHFVLDRGGRAFKNSVHTIKLPEDAGEDMYLGLLGLLNSSIICFWLKQSCHNKGSTVDQYNARQRTAPFEDFFAFNATALGKIPLVHGRAELNARRLDGLSRRLAELSPGEQLKCRGECRAPTAISASRVDWKAVRQKMVSVQEELDWQCYYLYGLIPDDLTTPDPPDIGLGQRAFEIVLARRMAKEEVQTTWFDRHGSTPITELPVGWPEDYKRLVERRIELIETDRNIGLIEQPEYKRRWNTEPWESQLERAVRECLLDLLERCCDCDGRMGKAVFSSGWSEEDLPPEDRGTGARVVAAQVVSYAPIQLLSVARLADIARHVEDFMQVGALYRNDPAFDVERLVAELVEAESVPLLSVLRYKPSGLRKRAEWEQTWELQREEDRLAAQPSPQPSPEGRGGLLDIPVPPKYTSADFLKSGYWRLRGKLDVPKERWVSFPHCEGPDGTLVIAWAGYDHLQLARAISAYYVDIQERLGGRDDPRLVPLLACLLELLPWVKQWHNEPDVAFDGMRMGDYFEGFVNEEARQLGKTTPEIKAWQPPQRRAGRGRNK